jgi:hypothetical protein
VPRFATKAPPASGAVQAAGVGHRYPEEPGRGHRRASRASHSGSAPGAAPTASGGCRRFRPAAEASLRRVQVDLAKAQAAVASVTTRAETAERLLENARAELQAERDRNDVSLSQLHEQLAQLMPETRRGTRRPRGRRRRRSRQRAPSRSRVRGRGADIVSRTRADTAVRKPADTLPACPLTFRLRITSGV